MYQISINMSLGKTAHIKMITAKLTCSITELHCVVSGHSLYTCKCNTGNFYETEIDDCIPSPY